MTVEKVHAYLNSINSYEGRLLFKVGEIVFTESTIRPSICRFEAHIENEGEPSVFGKTLEDVMDEVEERWPELFESD